jgi:hypothetical protein
MRLSWSFCCALLVTAWAGGCGPGQAVEPAQATCDITLTGQCVAGPLNEKPCRGQPIEVGAHCDDIFICTDERQARAIMDVAPGFTCKPGAGEPAMCQGSAWTCQWVSPGTLDDAELDAICAVTVLPTPPANIACVVYV